MRLIDADYFDNKVFRNCQMEEGGIPLPDFVTHTKILKLYPTVDAVPVVRCEDCEWWKKIREDRGRCKHPRFSVDDDELDPVTEPNAFCSYGERKLLRLLPNCGAKMDGERKDNETD